MNRNVMINYSASGTDQPEKRCRGNRQGGYSIIFFSSPWKTYIVGTHLNRLIKGILMSTHNICFCGEICKWTESSEFGTYRLCEQRRFRRACASAQSCQNLRCSLKQAVNQEEPSDRKPDPWSLSMAGHAQLNFVMTECSKTQIRLTGLKYPLIIIKYPHLLYPIFSVFYHTHKTLQVK